MVSSQTFSEWKQTGLALAVGLVAVTFVRLHTLTEPLEADETVYAVIANDWMGGGRPYETLWDNKPIGTFIIYRLTITLLGYTETAVRLASMVAVWIATVCLYFAVRGLGLNRILTLLMLLLWALFNSLAACHANGANSEIFMLPFLAGAFLALQRYNVTRSIRPLSCCYLLVTLAFLIKQVCLPFFLVPLFFIPWDQWRNAKRIVPLLIGVGALVILMHGVVYGICGYSPGFLFGQALQNTRYLANDAGNSHLAPIRTALLFPFAAAIRPLLPITLFGGIGLLWLVISRRLRSDVMLLVSLVAAVLSVALPGKNFPHYYIVSLPFILLAVAGVMSVWRRRTQFVVTGMLIVFLGVVSGVRYFGKSPVEISFAKYGSAWFLQDRYIGEQLRDQGLTGKRIYVDGSHPGIYFYSNNLPATRYFVAWTYVAMKITTFGEVFAQLVAAQPAACVLMNPLDSPLVNDTFRSWLATNYVFVRDIAGAKLYLPRGEEKTTDEN